jgi:cobalt-precorrin 5A hydrolase
VPAIDEMAVERGLFIENPEAIRGVSMARIQGRPVWLYDPEGRLEGRAEGFDRAEGKGTAEGLSRLARRKSPGVVVTDIRIDLAPEILVLRPPSLVAGMGCNRGTDAAEMAELLSAVFDRYGLSPSSLRAIATVDVKRDEDGLLRLAQRLGVRLFFYSADELRSVPGVRSRSETVRQHIGVPNVCEAAAILGARTGSLVVPKQKSANATLAVARTPSSSWASAPATPTTSPDGRGRS